MPTPLLSWEDAALPSAKETSCLRRSLLCASLVAASLSTLSPFSASNDEERGALLVCLFTFHRSYCRSVSVGGGGVDVRSCGETGETESEPEDWGTSDRLPLFLFSHVSKPPASSQPSSRTSLSSCSAASPFSSCDRAVAIVVLAYPRAMTPKFPTSSSATRRSKTTLVPSSCLLVPTSSPLPTPALLPPIRAVSSNTQSANSRRSITPLCSLCSERGLSLHMPLLFLLQLVKRLRMQPHAGRSTPSSSSANIGQAGPTRAVDKVALRSSVTLPPFSLRGSDADDEATRAPT